MSFDVEAFDHDVRLELWDDFISVPFPYQDR
jgi:hypothetical protein